VRQDKSGPSSELKGVHLFRYDRDLHGQKKKYLNMTMSKKALQRERDNLRERTSHKVCFMPIPALIKELNRNLKGWANYFKLGYPHVRF
jgi:RNA-directed DNA polymerase